jgi:acyl carrier protein phosphodiesterase
MWERKLCAKKSLASHCTSLIYAYIYAMNYLAHAYLSFNDPEILTGNMISDFVKGRKKFNYSHRVQKGIALHRAIDQFTDDHPATRSANLFFKPTYRLYAGAFTDIVYDHFLATDVNHFISATALQKFSGNIYQLLENNFIELPLIFQKMFPYMKMQNWLFNYQYRSGIEKAFGGLARRAAYINEHYSAFSIFNEHYKAFKKCYEAFFPELKQFAEMELRNLLAND